MSSSITSNAISSLLPGMILPSDTSSLLAKSTEVEMGSPVQSKNANAKLNSGTKKDNNNGNSNKNSSMPSLVSKNSYPQPLTTGEVLANGLQLSVAPVRRYKQYTEETLQQALREIMEGQR